MTHYAVIIAMNIEIYSPNSLLNIPLKYKLCVIITSKRLCFGRALLSTCFMNKLITDNLYCSLNLPLDNIEANVEFAGTRVEQGKNQLGKAVKHKVREGVCSACKSFIPCFML